MLWDISYYLFWILIVNVSVCERETTWCNSHWVLWYYIIRSLSTPTYIELFQPVTLLGCKPRLKPDQAQAWPGPQLRVRLEFQQARWWAPWLSVRVFLHFRTVSGQSRDCVTCHRHHTTYPDLYRSFLIVCDDLRWFPSFLVICDDFYLRATSCAHCNSRISTMRHCGSYTVQ